MKNDDIIKIAVIAVGTIIGLIFFSFIIGFFGMGFGMMGGMMIGMGLFWIFILLVPIVIIIYFISTVSSKDKDTKMDDHDLNCDQTMADLRKRYATGKISRDIYMEIKRDLMTDCPDN